MVGNDEEMKERDYELIKAIVIATKATLKAKEDEIEMSKWVMAENVNLQVRVDSLTAELGWIKMEAVDLRGELCVKVEELAHAEKDRMAAMSEVAALGDTFLFDVPSRIMSWRC